MRLVIDSLIVIMLLAVLGGVVILHKNRKQGERELAQTQQALSALHAQTAYQSTVKSAMAGHEQVLVYIEPAWFGEQMPENQLVRGDRPWLDLAPPGDVGEHPPDPIILNDQQAAFWYNPTLGVFRARVEPQLSEAKTLELYNQVNTCQLLAFDVVPSADRRPMAHVPDQAPSRHYASLAAGWDSAAPEAATETQADAPAPQPAPAEATGRPAVIHEVGPATLPEDPIDQRYITTPDLYDDSASGGAETNEQPPAEPAPRPTLRR